MLGAWLVLVVLPLLIVGLALLVFAATRASVAEQPAATPEAPPPQSAPRA